MPIMSKPPPQGVDSLREGKNWGGFPYFFVRPAKLDPHVLAKLDEVGKRLLPCCSDQCRSPWIADRISSSLDSFAHAGARCHATRQHCSRDEAPRHPRRWLVLLLLRVGSSRRATSGTSTAFISNRADDSLVVAYLKGRWGCARIPITPPVCVVLL